MRGAYDGSKSDSRWSSHGHPFLIVRGAPRVIDFLQRAFDAELTHAPLKRPDGTIMHAEVQIGDSRVMIAEESRDGQSSAIIALPLRSRRR